MKKSKVYFGTKEVVTVIIATTTYLIAEWIQQALVASGILSADSYNYFKLRVLVIMLAATVQGPIVGVLVALAGTLLTNLIFYGYVSGAEVVAYIINAIVLGYYSKRLLVSDGGFRGMRVVDFNVIQMVTNIFCSLMFSPVFLFLTEDMNLDLAVRTGSKSAIGNVVGIGVLATPILMIVSKINKMRHPERMAQNTVVANKTMEVKTLEFDERVRTMYKERL